MVVALLSELYHATKQYGFDIALVTIKSDIFAAIQVQRKRFAARHNIWDQFLSQHLKDEAERLSVMNLIL